MEKPVEGIYSTRNLNSLSKNFEYELFEKERGELFKKWIGTGKSVLDIGCRYCRMAMRWYGEGNKVMGLDIDGESLKYCPPEYKTQQFDLNGDWHLDKKEQFDVIVATETIEHLYYPEKVVQKISFALKPGGYLVGSVPNAFNLKNRIRLFLAQTKKTTMREPTHIHHFSYQEMKRLLEANFSEVEMVPLVQPKWQWFANIFPGLGSFLIAFRARKK